MRKLPILAFSALALAAPMFASAAAEPAAPAGARNIVIVHGSFVDGSGWRVVHDILIHKGYHVTVVHQPATSLDADVAATREILDQQVGPVVLVGHSSGGAVIGIAGDRDKVKALVYVAGLQPEVGETLGQLLGSMPSPSNDIHATRDGLLFVDRAKFGEDFAADQTTNRTDFLAASQVPAAAATFGTQNWAAAWHKKPSYGIVATDDKALNPDLQRWMYKRAGSKVTEIKASHTVYISQPEAVAKVIEQAALNAK
ncbi:MULTISPECIES: alpha/beta fold hydrolase [Pseudomonas]|uniref:Putative hydrolase or acyltransferase of alpha/beta superfamily n=1 Tax=Pseudomonas asplenii TaxID=53407 RepID=A0A0N0E2F8_9PSED|nr:MULTISPECIES: alpha/beta hydrolase [Pseudomonas]KPA88843.1 putative hydrolase or acyltransferase of alpha/beta superfamily [Pseudomonas fuscovaginae]KPA98317.1 putative hydrolase or acyltransferase of alpha/beta superfamily [Pseudomonas fuscovaginae]